ncbi:MAG: hypothetical protein QGI24_09890 [Kiritimatiellia bacterium]|jgi:hypothetical protein|nr:hypothetical protein [Kiritimatiellia bacterium]
MNEYEITFQLDGHRYQDHITATSYFDARRLIEARYPGVVILNVQQVS